MEETFASPYANVYNMFKKAKHLIDISFWKLCVAKGALHDAKLTVENNWS